MIHIKYEKILKDCINGYKGPLFGAPGKIQKKYCKLFIFNQDIGWYCNAGGGHTEPSGNSYPTKLPSQNGCPLRVKGYKIVKQGEKK